MHEREIILVRMSGLLDAMLARRLPVHHVSPRSQLHYHIKQECIPIGCVPFIAAAVGGGGMSAQGGVSLWDLPRGCLPGGCPPGGEGLPQCMLRYTPCEQMLVKTLPCRNYVADGN